MWMGSSSVCSSIFFLSVCFGFGIFTTYIMQLVSYWFKTVQQDRFLTHANDTQGYLLPDSVLPDFCLITFFLDNLTILSCLIFPHNHFQKLEGLQEQEVAHCNQVLAFHKAVSFYSLSSVVSLACDILGVGTLPAFPFSLSLCITIAVVDRGKVLFHAFCSRLKHVHSTFLHALVCFGEDVAARLFTADITPGI